MTRAPCNRTWEIEALEDGRLAPKDRASLTRHIESCEACVEAAARLRELGKLLVDAPKPERTELERRRARAVLLERANRGVMGDAQPRRWLPAALALALVVATLGLLVRWDHGRSRAPASALAPAPVATGAAPQFEVTDVAHADFSAERVGGTSRITLRSGTASFHVEHVKEGARFLVALPDGELEVRGTRFVVDATGGHTRSVVVTEGAVALRVADYEGVLHAGERWPKVGDATAPPPPSSVTSPLASAVSATPAPSAPAAAPSSSDAARRLPGPRFAEAMGAFNAGDYGEADRLFVAYARDFPDDTRSEDALFLVADARARRGDMAGAREAANVYLLRYPTGLRAPAAARFAAPPASQLARPPAHPEHDAAD